MKNPHIKSLKSLCIRAKRDNKKLYFLYTSTKEWFVCLKDFGYTRSYKSFDFIHAALLKACAKYGVDYLY